ncbi:hypothetical protein [Candidatus Leptofilum sp.]
MWPKWGRMMAGTAGAKFIGCLGCVGETAVLRIGNGRSPAYNSAPCM